MTWKDTVEPALSRLPVVDRPDGHVSFNNKFMWTGAVLLVYFALTNVQLWGLGTGGQGFGYFRTIVAGAQGSILQLGIGPIVTASITLQLLKGANLLGLDTESDPRDQVLYQGLQKMLVVFMTLLTAAPMAFTGAFLQPSQALASALGVSVFVVQVLMYLQIVVGGLIIVYLDEVISKWGLGSGVGLFIVAGVSQQLIGAVFATEWLTGTSGILAAWVGLLTGETSVESIFTAAGLEQMLFGPLEVAAIATTLFIFGLVVFAESVRVEIPLNHARVSGAAGRFPVKLIYASVLPMIIVRSVQANIQIMGRALDSTVGLPAFIGVYSGGEPVSGLMYFLNPIRAPQDWMWFLGGTSAEVWEIAIRLGMDFLIMVGGGAIAAVFWVEATGMGSASSAKQIQNSGMQIPGFRRNPQVIEKVLDRYIPHVTVLGGALVGFLAVTANLIGTIGQVSGIGLLLAVSITYKLYEEIAEEKMMEMHPMMRQLFNE